MTSRLTVSVVSPEFSQWNRVEVKLLVDGVDMIGEAFPEGPFEAPNRLLGPRSPLLAADGPREVRLAEADCTEGCCGALYVWVRREGDQIVWFQWRDPDDPDLSLPEVRFDLAQYTAELERAHTERTWEWPALTVARLVEDALRQDPDVLGQWNASLDGANSYPGERDQVTVLFTSPPRHTLSEHWEQTREILAHDQFRLRLRVFDTHAAETAAHIVAMLRDSDPRRTAKVCGGYRPQS